MELQDIKQIIKKSLQQHFESVQGLYATKIAV